MINNVSVLGNLLTHSLTQSHYHHIHPQLHDNIVHHGRFFVQSARPQPPRHKIGDEKVEQEEISLFISIDRSVVPIGMDWPGLDWDVGGMETATRVLLARTHRMNIALHCQLFARLIPTWSSPAS